MSIITRTKGPRQQTLLTARNEDTSPEPAYLSAAPSFVYRLRLFRKATYVIGGQEVTAMRECLPNLYVPVEYVSSQIKYSDRHIIALDIDKPVSLIKINKRYVLFFMEKTSCRRERLILKAFKGLGLVGSGDEASILRYYPKRSLKRNPLLLVPLNIPVELIPSRTPGHFHLFLDKECEWAEVVRMLTLLKHAKVLDPSWVKKTIQRGCVYMHATV